MESMWLLLGMTCGFIIGTQYIPHQIKKKNQKVIKQVKALLEKIDK